MTPPPHIFIFLPKIGLFTTMFSLETWGLTQQRQRNKLSDFNNDPDWTSTITFPFNDYWFFKKNAASVPVKFFIIHLQYCIKWWLKFGNLDKEISYRWVSENVEEAPKRVDLMDRVRRQRSPLCRQAQGYWHLKDLLAHFLKIIGT